MVSLPQEADGIQTDRGCGNDARTHHVWDGQTSHNCRGEDCLRLATQPNSSSPLALFRRRGQPHLAEEELHVVPHRLFRLGIPQQV